jgi:hypothetical protein
MRMTLRNTEQRSNEPMSIDERYAEAVAKIRAYMATGLQGFYQQGIDRLADLGVNVSGVRQATQQNASLLVEMYGHEQA